MSNPADDIRLDDVRRISVRSGDLLVITVPRGTPHETFNTLTETLGDWFPDVHVLVVTNDVGLGILERSAE